MVMGSPRDTWGHLGDEDVVLMLSMSDGVL